MSTNGDIPSPSSSGEESYDESDASDGTTEPRYTPKELQAIFVDFYSFMTTLTYDKSHLKIPPPIGWPQITPESCGHYKSDYAIEVIRHLPYFDSNCKSYIHYKSKLVDLTGFSLQDFERHKGRYKNWEFWSSEGELRDNGDVVCIAVGYESFGRELWLNVIDCEIFEDFHAGDMLDAVPVETFFANLREKYETLKLIPGKGRITIEAEDVPEHVGRITEEEVNNQKEEWGTDLDIQYVRQVYRDHNWPRSFDLEAASLAIDNWLDPSGESLGCGPRGYGWPESPPDWDASPWT
ncbi:hypothetical protein FPOAC2_07488 [Fusarium poae]|nr:hypothetical protein FPOAC1_010094 [Fusarium poae]KAG8670661.1 hypothetical protein FPOAC1_010094 [Fusarium poae]